MASPEYRYLNSVRVSRGIVEYLQDDPIWLSEEQQYKVLNPIEGALMALLLLSTPSPTAVVGGGKVGSDGENRPRWDVALAVRMGCSLVLPSHLMKIGLWASVLKSETIYVPDSGPIITFSTNSRNPFGPDTQLVKQFHWDNEVLPPEMLQLCALPLGPPVDSKGDLLHTILGICCGSVPVKKREDRSEDAHVALLAGACMAGCADTLALELDLFPEGSRPCFDIDSSVARKDYYHNPIDPVVEAARSSLRCLKVLHRKRAALLRRGSNYPGTWSLLHTAVSGQNLPCVKFLTTSREDGDDKVIVSKEQILELESTRVNRNLPTIVARAVQKGDTVVFNFLVHQLGFSASHNMLPLAPEGNPVRPSLLAALKNVELSET